jgi:hypothetical protein
MPGAATNKRAREVTLRVRPNLAGWFTLLYVIALRLNEKESVMSTDYRLLKKVRACDLFDGCLEEFGVREHVKPDETTKKKRCLTDGRNYLWVHIDDGGLVASLSRYAPNGDPVKILNAIALEFDADVVSEYEPQYWGFDTQEEWDAAQEGMSREHEENFLNELLKYLRGEPNEIKPGTIGMTQAEIAQKLVQKDPTLLSPIHKDRLCKVVRMIASDKDDLPRA